MDHSRRYICLYCANESYLTNSEFALHLRMLHCSQEGGSFVCRYGPHDVCKSLPIEGVADADYSEHVKRDHLKESCNLKDCDSSNQEQNLAAVLNDPRKSRHEVTSFFTRYWSDGFVDCSTSLAPSSLPSLSFDHFANSLSGAAKRRTRRACPKSSDSGSCGRNRTGKGTTCEFVPAMFLSNKFSLQDSQCFEALFFTANLEMLPEVAIGATEALRRQQLLSPSKSLLEKLSSYLDLIEIQIARHVSAQSASFLHAMTSHDDLVRGLGDLRCTAHQLRDQLGSVDKRVARRGLRLLTLKRRRFNCELLQEKATLIGTVKQTQNVVQGLLNAEDYVGAVELISTTQSVLKTKLADVMCLRHLDAQLDELRNIIAKMLLMEFSQLLERELNISQLAESAISSEKYVEMVDETTMATVVAALCRAHETKLVLLLNEQVCNCIKKLVRKTVQCAVEAIDIRSPCDDSSRSEIATNSLAEQMRKLNFDDWIAMLCVLVDKLQLLITKIKHLLASLLDLLELIGDVFHDSTIISAEQTSVASLDILADTTLYLKKQMDTCMLHAISFAQERMVRVVAARFKDDLFEKLSAQQCVKLSESLERFIDHLSSTLNVESGSRNSAAYTLPLRPFMQHLMFKFLSRFHEDNKTKLSGILDLEQWRKADVPVIFQQMVDEFERSGYLPDFSQQGSQAKNSDLLQSYLVVSGERYTVAGVGLIMLQLISPYYYLINNLRDYAAEVVERLVDLLKTFNSRTCQLVLGAGALQLVGLKSIGVRTLALASRSLQLILFFIAVLTSAFQLYEFKGRSLCLRHMEQLRKDYQDHLDEIFGKLLSIMECQISGCLTKWDCAPPVPSPCFQQIVKTFKRFHNNLSDVLPSDQLQRLLFRLHSLFKTLFSQRLSGLGISPINVSAYGLCCSEFSFYMESLKQLPCCSAIDEGMNEVLQCKL